MPTRTLLKRDWLLTVGDTMAKSIKKIPFPDWLANTDYFLALNESGISEDGEPIKSVEKDGKCIFSEKAKRIVDSEGKEIILSGKVIIKGDVAPSLKTISDGAITINNKKFEIHTGSRPRNPDGTIHSTHFEVI